MADLARDRQASGLLVALREQRRLMPEEVPHAMFMAGIDPRCIPSSRTVRRIEADGVIPRLRLQFGLADFYGRERHLIWQSAGRPMEVAA
jgi:hypothetical protein